LVEGVAILDPADDAAVGREGHDVIASDVEATPGSGGIMAEEGIDQPEELHHALVLKEGEGGREEGRKEGRKRVRTVGERP